MKRFSLPFLVLLSFHTLWAQQHEEMGNLRMLPRANVVSYDDENAIERLQYDQSSSLLSLADDWTISLDSGRYVMVSDYEFPRDWKSYRIFFQMHAPSGYGFWMGDKLVGISHDCASVAEFDITDLIRFGKTMRLAVRYMGDDDGRLLDPRGVNAQPQCTLFFKPLLNVQDYTITAEYSLSGQSGVYSIEADLYNAKAKGKCYLEVELWDSKGHQVDKLGKWCFFDKRTETTQTISSTLSNILPWNAETPRLYTAVIRLFDDKMELQDIVGTRFGFRSLACQRVLSLNGKTLNLKGVTLHLKDNLASPDALKRLRTQMVQMKCNNINAIHVTGGNPSPRLLELCDELGFYVICDANLFPTSSMGHAVATDNEYSDLFADRVRALYGVFKNHPSVIAWSLGSSPDNGVCMQVAYKELKRLDHTRPVVYSGAQYADNTDIIAPSDCSLDILNQFMAKSQPRPLLMLDYGDAIGNSFGGLSPLWQKVCDNANIQGGFLNVGDWQSFLSMPYLAECKHLYRPFDIKLLSTSHDAAEFEISNWNDFRALSDYTLDYVIRTTSNPNVVAGDVALSLKPGESKSIKLKVPKLSLPAGEDLSIVFTLRQRGVTQVVPKNTVLYTQQYLLPTSHEPALTFQPSQGNPLHIEKDSLHGVHIYNETISLLFDDSLGLITSLSYKGNKLITQPVRLNFMRPPSQNDAIDPNGIRQWMQYDLGNMDCELVAANCHQLDQGVVGIDVMFRYSTPRRGDLFDARQAIIVYPTGDVMINNDITLSEQIKSVAKVGLQMGISRQLDTAEWYGRNVESYSDRHDAGIITHQSRPIPTLFHQYQTVQHAGNYAETRWAAFRNAEVGLYVDILDTLCNFSIYPYQDSQMLGAREEMGWPGVEEQDYWTLNIDSRIAGVGGAIGRIFLDESSVVKSRKYQFTLHLRPFDCKETTSASQFRSIAYPKVRTHVIEIPTISKSRDRFDAPMLVTISCATPKVELRYTLDGTVPTAMSPLYTKPFSIQNSVVVKARAFRKGEAPSFVASQQFTFDYIVSCTFAHKPNTPYNKNASKALFDGEVGDVNDLSHGWLGFSGHPFQADMELGKSIRLSHVVLRFAHVPDAWVFAPAQVEIQVSADGKNYSDPIPATITYDPSSESMNTTQLQVITIPAEKEDVRFVRVVAKPIGRIPQWHRAKGLNPWIMVDEVEIKEIYSDQ